MFEESKIWILAILVGILISVGYGTHYLNLVDEANLALLESKSKLSDMQEQVAMRQREWSEREKGAANVQVEADKHATLLKAHEALEKRFSKTASELTYALDSMKSSVEKTRNNAPGTELGEVTLASGKVLRGVRVRKVEESGISLIHADGIGNVPVDLLPEDLKEKYDLGPKALLPVLRQAHTSFVAKTKDEPARIPAATQPPVPVPAPTAAPPPSQPTSAVEDPKVKQIKLRMAELDSQLSGYDKVIKQYQDSARSDNDLASAAQGRGQPSALHTSNANEKMAQAAALELRAVKVRQELKKLEVELEYAMKK